MKKYIISLVLIVVSYNLSYGQELTIKGNISTDANDGAQASISLIYGDTTIVNKSNKEGAFKIRFASPDDGKFPLFLQVSASGVEPYEQLIEASDFVNGVCQLTITLQAELLSEIVVKARANQEKKSNLLIKQKNAIEMSQSIGAAEMTRKGSTDVAQGLSKMSGITQVSQRGIYVRGLDDRYNSLTINDLSLGSPNPDNKIIPLDLIPSDIIKTIYVHKTFNPSLHGDFVGATIGIETKDYPQKQVLEVSAKINYNTNSTFNNFKQLTNNRFANFTGYELAERTLPTVYSSDNLGVYQSNASESKTLFPTKWNNAQFVAPPSISLSVRYGDRKVLRNNNTLGYYISMKFNNNYVNNRGVNRRLNSVGTELNNFDFAAYTYETQKSGLATLSYITQKGISLTANVIYINNTSNVVTENFGFNGGLTVNDFFSRDNTYEFSNLLAGQLLGDYEINEHHLIKLGLAYSVGQDYFPDRKLLRTENQGANARYITENGITPFTQFLSLDNTELSGYLKYVFKINDQHTIKLGYDLTQSAYTLFNRVISVIQNSSALPVINTDNPDLFFDANFDNGKLYYKDPVDPSKQVEIYNTINSLYVDYIVGLGKFKVEFGVRAEFTQRDIYYRNFKMSIFDNFLLSSYNPVFFLPSLNVKYALNPKSNLRFTISNTITRPRLREVIPVDYQDGNGNNLQGNENLNFPNAYNVDLKYELFPASAELFSFTLFGKYIQSPIERVFVPITTGRAIQFNNFDVAYIAGIEHEADINIGRILKMPALTPLSFGYNITLMFTRVSIDLDNPQNSKFKFLTETERPLQGASALLVNFDIAYAKKISDNWTTTISLLFNTFSERIFAVGVEGANNLVEQPQYNLDFIFQNKINKRITITLAAKNMLNTTILFTQKSVVNPEQIDPTAFRTNRGANISLTLAYGF